MVVPLQVSREDHVAEVKAQVEKHLELTGSARAKEILDNWEHNVKKIVRVIPKEKHALELAEEAHENAGEIAGA
jgi:glutamate synthase domain-containing protein 3